jgi:hypothetical protein
MYLINHFISMIHINTCGVFIQLLFIYVSKNQPDQHLSDGFVCKIGVTDIIVHFQGHPL